MKRLRKAPRRQRAATTASREHLLRVSREAGATIDIKQLADLTGDHVNTTYKKVNAGMFPSIRLGGRGKIAVLTQPTIEILLGQRPPGGSLPDRPAKKRRTVKRAKKKRAAKSKPAARKSEAAGAVVP